MAYRYCCLTLDEDVVPSLLIDLTSAKQYVELLMLGSCPTLGRSSPPLKYRPGLDFAVDFYRNTVLAEIVIADYYCSHGTISQTSIALPISQHQQ